MPVDGSFRRLDYRSRDVCINKSKIDLLTIMGPLQFILLGPGLFSLADGTGSMRFNLRGNVCLDQSTY